jgi:hypothetical protein
MVHYLSAAGVDRNDFATGLFGSSLASHFLPMDRAFGFHHSAEPGWSRSLTRSALLSEQSTSTRERRRLVPGDDGHGGPRAVQHGPLCDWPRRHILGNRATKVALAG